MSRIEGSLNTRSDEDGVLAEVLKWCSSVMGSVKVVSNHSRDHAGHRAGVVRLRTASGYCYAKTYHDSSHWDSEVHAYEQWAGAFGASAAKLLAVRDEEPLAIVVSELPGKIFEGVQLSVSQQQSVWRAAGRSLVALHNLAVGQYFGFCRRDGTWAGTPITNAMEYVSASLEERLERGIRASYLSDDDQAIVHTALGLVPAFEGESPIPCHRDYCPNNWLVNDNGVWGGVIDFEFAHWDVRVSDFTRYPAWEWIARPDLVEAFFDGYGRWLTPQKELQRLLAHTQYALDAIIWGRENSYHGFADEGQRALKRLGELLG